MTKPSIFNIFQEDNGFYSFARVWGSVFNTVGVLFLLYGVVNPESIRAFESGFGLIGIGYGGKILQKPFEEKVFQSQEEKQ